MLHTIEAFCLMVPSKQDRPPAPTIQHQYHYSLLYVMLCTLFHFRLCAAIVCCFKWCIRWLTQWVNVMHLNFFFLTALCIKTSTDLKIYLLHSMFDRRVKRWMPNNPDERELKSKNHSQFWKRKYIWSEKEICFQ